MKLTKDMIPRGADPTGHGHYGAKRGLKRHRGFDIAIEAGEDVFSPISGVVTKIGYPYAKDLSFRYIDVTGEVYKTRIMYINPLTKIGDRIFEGDLIAYAQDISSKWNPKMINHIHLEVYKHGLLTDPEPLLEL